MYMNAHCWIHQKYLTQLIAKFKVIKHWRSKGNMMELSRAYHLQILKENIQFCGLEEFHLSRMSLMTLFIAGSLAWKFASLRFTAPGDLLLLHGARVYWMPLSHSQGILLPEIQVRHHTLVHWDCCKENYWMLVAPLPAAKRPHVIFIARQGKHGKLRIHCKDNIAMVWIVWLLQIILTPNAFAMHVVVVVKDCFTW